MPSGFTKQLSNVLETRSREKLKNITINVPKIYIIKTH